ncbi:hypothetical protein [Massilia timonae]
MNKYTFSRDTAAGCEVDFWIATDFGATVFDLPHFTSGTK